MIVRLESAAILGKVPWQEEYVRVQVEGQPFTTFDAWVTENIEFAALRGGNDWADAYRTGGIHAFVFRLPGAAGQPFLAGAIGPSSDRAGRNYPLAVASPVAQTKELDRTPEALPIVLEPFWEHASRIVAEACSTRDLDLGQQLAGIRRETAIDPTAALSSYAEWMRQLPLAELWALIYGESDSSRSAIGVRLILEAIRPYRGVERPETPLTLRLPLGATGGAAVCFWIDLVKRSARWETTVPSFFWSHDGRSGAMLLHLGHPPKSTLAELWMPTGTRDEFCDLGASIRPEQVRSLRELPVQLSRIFSSAESTVHDLMVAIESTAAAG